MSWDIRKGTSKILEAPTADQAGTPISYTGASVVLLVSTELSRMTTPVLFDIPATVSGSTFSVAFAPADTAGVAAGDYMAEWHITYSDGTVYIPDPFVFSVEAGGWG